METDGAVVTGATSTLLYCSKTEYSKTPENVPLLSTTGSIRTKDHAGLSVRLRRTFLVDSGIIEESAIAPNFLVDDDFISLSTVTVPKYRRDLSMMNTSDEYFLLLFFVVYSFPP